MITILRLGHRIFRDQRVTTHCALVSRALGAKKFIYTGQQDKALEKSVNDIVKQWGGSFSISYISSYKKYIKSFKGKKAHLTVYGLPLQKTASTLRKQKNLLVIVGGSKVPAEVYHMVDWNVSVTSQPHSEIAGITLLLDRYFQGKELTKTFPKAKHKVVPNERGKTIKTI